MVVADKGIVKDKIKIIEEYVRSLPEKFKVAHGFSHVDRVRHWALKIARAEHFQNLELVEAAALLHDVGRTIPPEKGKSHGELSARLSRKFLSEKKLFTREEQEKICEAVENHCNVRGIDSKLLDILRDADILDLLGAIGILRGAAAEHEKTTFDPKLIKGETWQMSNEDFNENYRGKFGTWPTMPDQINFQMSCFDNLKTDLAKKTAKPMADYMKNFILEVEKEAKQ